MKEKIIEQIINLGNGKTITIETGKLARQADGAVVVKMGGTMLLATVVSNKEPKEGLNFLPLTVEYKEKYASGGKIPGGFFKREARPHNFEILTSRLIDRALRPLFPDNYRCETQVLVSLLSYDKENQPDALACLAASSAIAVSDINFNGPVSEVKVARVENQLVINPTVTELENADIKMIVAATMENVVMVEGEMQEIAEAEMLEVIQFAHSAIKIQCQAQLDLAAKIEKAQTKRELVEKEKDNDLLEQIRQFAYDKYYEIAKSAIQDKHERKDVYKAIKEDFISNISEEAAEEKSALISDYFHDIEKEAIRRLVVEERVRLDGRKTDEIRPIWSEVDYLPGTHGSAIFTRGETQSLTTITLGNKLDEQIIDGITCSENEKIMLHYNFPPFSTGEAKPLRGVSRREIGHGYLALRALKTVIPSGVKNPYTIRIVSDILESNGSSSMATVCAGTLALMDAGIQISKPVSGIAMGLITDNNGKYAILSDILGDEDHLGDMDFKVTGTRDGITACQMDIKVEGLSYEVLAEALEQAKRGRLHILDEMSKTLAVPNSDYKPHTPRIVQLTIPKEFIGAVIGPGGKIIQKMQEETNTTIVLEEVNGVGVVDIISENKEDIDEAVNRINAITEVPEVGKIYKGKVKAIMPFGAFIEILPGKDGLLHISEIEWKRLESVESVLKEGDEVEVKLIEVDVRSGKLRLSRKVLLPRPEKV